MKCLVIALVLHFFALIHGKPALEEMHRVFYMDMKPNAALTNLDNCIFNLCNQTTAYKDHELKAIVSKHKEYLPLFGNVLDHNRTVIETRFGEEEKMNMCKTRSVTMFPRQGRTINEELKNIVNVEGYHQMVSFEACDDGAECYARKEYLPVGVTTSCETQYIVIRLVVINDNNTLGLERFSIPAGCSCMYSQITTY